MRSPPARSERFRHRRKRFYDLLPLSPSRSGEWSLPLLLLWSAGGASGCYGDRGIPSPPSLVNLSFFPSFLPSSVLSVALPSAAILRPNISTDLSSSSPSAECAHIFQFCALFPNYSPNLAPDIQTRQRDCCSLFRGFNFMVPYYHTLSTTNNNAQRAGGARLGESQEFFSHLLHPASQNNKLPPSFQQHGGREL